MIDAYDTLMDSLAALAVEAVCMPVTAVQSYWLLLVAQQAISGASLTLGGLLRQAQEDNCPTSATLGPATCLPGPGAPMARGGMVGNAWVAGPAAGVHGHGCHVSEPGGGALEDGVSAVYR